MTLNMDEIFKFIIESIDLDHDVLLYLTPQIITECEVHPRVDGPDAMDCILEMIRDAKEFIHLSVMLFFNDPEGQAIAQALSEKAHEGVTVRVMVDVVTTLLGNNPSTPLPFWDRIKRGDFAILEKK